MLGHKPRGSHIIRDAAWPSGGGGLKDPRLEFPDGLVVKDLGVTAVAQVTAEAWVHSLVWKLPQASDLAKTIKKIW